MTSRPAFYHALLRPTILQILRATGYYACKPATLDFLTDLAARYLELLAEKTASHALTNGSAESPTVVDVRMALQDVAAVLPERCASEQAYMGVEDTRGMDEFLAWFGGPRDKMIREYAAVDGDPDATDFLTGESLPFSSKPCSFLSCGPGLILTRGIPSPKEETQQDRRGLQVPCHHPRQGQRPGRGPD